jgi:ornithine cyclodeaminase/alanine dehydrogenase
LNRSLSAARGSPTVDSSDNVDEDTGRSRGKTLLVAIPTIAYELPMTRLYSTRDVERHLDLEAALDVVETTYVETARGRVLNPSKLTMHLGDDGEWPDRNAFAIDMPAYVDWLGVAGTKWAVATWDVETETPISSLLLLFDLDRGAFTAVMEGMYLTGVRTALQSVVGLKHLHPDDPDSVGVFGAGFQARFQVQVVDALCDVTEFHVYDVDEATAHDLASELGPQVDADIVVSDAPEPVAASDAVLTVTNSKTPVLEEAWLDDAAFVVALGTYRELPDETIRAADHLVVDHREQCLQRGVLSDLAARGELTAEDMDATIGEYLAEAYDREIAGDDRVLFVPIGMGSLDVAIAETIYQNGSQPDDLETFAFV